MNFLAHLYTSGEDCEIILGNFIADHVKGNKILSFSPKVQAGIRLHRTIDAFTDSHPIVTQSKQRLRLEYGKYASVIVDIYYDHFLAKYWNEYSDKKLLDYTASAYRLLMRNFFNLPSRTKKLLPFMVKSNWLYSYRDTEFLKWVFERMAQRTRFHSGMETAVLALLRDYNDYEIEFRAFFSLLTEFAEKELKQLNVDLAEDIMSK
ncbi:MAG: DUF479 domain-containing protein [Bacteroidales bacterium]|nr:DUF479 domain-containing protein [Bacteroidales bacterium]